MSLYLAAPIKIRLESQACAILKEMAKEAGLSLHDMAEVAVLSVIGGYINEHPDALDPQGIKEPPPPVIR